MKFSAKKQRSGTLVVQREDVAERGRCDGILRKPQQTVCGEWRHALPIVISCAARTSVFSASSVARNPGSCLSCFSAKISLATGLTPAIAGQRTGRKTITFSFEQTALPRPSRGKQGKRRYRSFFVLSFASFACPCVSARRQASLRCIFIH